MPNFTADIIIFTGGLILGTGMAYFAHNADLTAQDKTIASLEKQLKSVPVITLDAMGICKVDQGGKTFMLIDVTNELRGIDTIDESYRAPEQEIDKEVKQ